MTEHIIYSTCCDKPIKRIGRSYYICPQCGADQTMYVMLYWEAAMEDEPMEEKN